MRRISIVACIVLAFISTGVAQIPGGNIFIGYSYDNANLGSGTHHNLNGWNGSLEGKVLPWVGIVADLSGLYGSGDSFVNTRCTAPIGNPCNAFRTHASLHNVLFGPRVSVPIGRFTPFAHALFGVSHVSESASGFSDSSTSFGEAFGGGIDYRIIHGIGWRFQGDDLQTRFFGGKQNSFRFSTGLVFHF
ncbi:MAG TPA: outer membrane beta-barrel protein [Terriglobales bacterium]|nr:outer membrane beta-barrel protein [Terriglobales bacterium]